MEGNPHEKEQNIPDSSESLSEGEIALETQEALEELGDHLEEHEELVVSVDWEKLTEPDIGQIQRSYDQATELVNKLSITGLVGSVGLTLAGILENAGGSIDQSATTFAVSASIGAATGAFFALGHLKNKLDNYMAKNKADDWHEGRMELN